MDMHKVYPNHLDLFKFNVLCNYWIPGPSFLRLISELPENFSRHIPPILRRQMYLNTGSFCILSVRNGHVSKPHGSYVYSAFDR